MESLLSLENLSKSFQEGKYLRKVLENASAQFEKGEFVAILGRSGSGKSTLLNLISGIDRPDSGNIYFKGQELIGMDDTELTLMRRKFIGFIFQFFNLLPTLTIQENVSLPLELNGVPSDSTRSKVLGILESVGLIDRKDAFPEKLSGGEQQRVALARALVHDPSLVLADEPTGNLDERTSHQVLELLDLLTRQSGRNLIMVTHNADAAAYADRVLQLIDGRLNEE
jgi:putative ABC transport system ATP-binding protein